MSAQDEFHDVSIAASPAPGPRARTSTLGANALILVGLALTAGGAACIASEHVSWTLHRLAGRVAAYGISFDVVSATGLFLFAVGMVARGVSRVARQVGGVSDDQVDLALVVDQLLGEVADVRSGIDQILTQAPDDQASVEESIRGQNEKDALFRMAASLDQLGGRLTQRISTDFGALKGELARLAAGTERLAARIGALESAGKPAAPARPVPAIRPLASAAAPRVAAPARAPVAERPVSPAAVDAPAQARASAADAQKQTSASAEHEDAVVIDLDSEDGGLELLDRLGEEVEGRGKDAPAINLYDPPPALPGPAPRNEPKPRTYDSSLDRLMPDQRVRDALDESR